MKRSLALLLTSLLLVFSLAACGKDQQPGGVDGTGSVNGTGDVNGTDNANGAGTANGSDNSGLTGSNGAGTSGSVTGGVNSGNGGTMMDGALDTMEDVGDAARNVVRGTGDALTGGTTGYTRNQMNGYSYDQMVQNGRVF